MCDGHGGGLELAMLVGQLSDLGIRLYGPQELRWSGKSECNIPVEGGDWSVLWLGGDMGCQQGVGLLILPRWKHAMFSFC